jgi:hypothetical protein
MAIDLLRGDLIRLFDCVLYVVIDGLVVYVGHVCGFLAGGWWFPEEHVVSIVCELCVWGFA